MDYCRRSANPVGRLVLRIAGYDRPELDAASDAVCTALQLTNFWQDLEIDWAKGRLYVPASIWQPAGAKESDLTARQLTPRVARRAGRRRRAGRGACSRPARPSVTACADACAGSCAPPGSAARGFWISWRPRDFDVFAQTPVAHGRRRAVHRVRHADLASATNVARDTSFYYSFLVLPADKRRAIVAVWDFCRAVDDAVDEAEGGNAAAEVTRWREELARCFDGGTPQTPQGRALQPLIGAFNLPRPAFEALIEGVEMDLHTTRYATFADLYRYCIRVASAVGLMCVEIFGCKDPASRQYAIDLGVALQLTNILRDVPGDLERGRVYIPTEDLARFGVRRRRPRRRVRARRPRRPVAGGQAAAGVPGAARPRLLPQGRCRPAALRRAPPGRRQDHGRDLSRHPRPDRGRGLRRLQPGDPRPASSPRADRRDDLGDDRPDRPLTRDRQQLRRRGDRRRRRRAGGGDGAGRSGAARARARGAGRARRPRHGVHRSRDRRARRQRPARPLRLLPGDVQAAAPDRRRGERPDAAVARGPVPRRVGPPIGPALPGAAVTAASGRRGLRLGRARAGAIG